MNVDYRDRAKAKARRLATWAHRAPAHAPLNHFSPAGQWPHANNCTYGW